MQPPNSRIDVDPNSPLAHAIERMHRGERVELILQGEPVAALVEPEALSILEERLDGPLLDDRSTTSDLTGDRWAPTEIPFSDLDVDPADAEGPATAG